MALFRQPDASKIHPSDWSQAPIATKILAALAILSMAAGIYLIFLAGDAYEMQGPVRIAANSSDTTLIATYKQLYLVDATGHVRRLDAADLGLVGPINSIHVDNDKWLLGDEDSGQLYSCAFDLSGCQPRFPARNGASMFSRSHGVAFVGDKLVVSDSERHRLRVFDATGKEIVTTRTLPIELCYPNEVVAVDGQLYVTDTNNFRIARVDPTRNYRSETFIQTSGGAPVKHANCADVSSHVAKRGDSFANLILDTTTTTTRPARPPARPGRIWPTALLHSSRGDWWAIQMKNGMEAGDVIIYTKDGRPIKRVPLPDDSDPTDMIETDQAVRITDPTLSKVYEATLDGQLVGEWGSNDLRMEFSDIVRQRKERLTLQPIGWAIIGLSAVFIVIVIVRELIRVKGNWRPNVVRLEPDETPPAVLNAHEVWLDVEPQFAGQAKRSAWMLAGAGVVFCVMIYLLIEPAINSVPAKQAAAIHRFVITLYGFAALAVVLFIVSARSMHRQAHMRIGTNGRQLLFDSGNDTVTACDFREVLASNHVLLVGNRFISIFNQRGKPIFPADRLRPLILARIPRNNFVTWPRLAIESLRRGSLSAWSTLIATVIYIATQIFPILLPDQSTAIGKLIFGWLSH